MSIRIILGFFILANNSFCFELRTTSDAIPAGAIEVQQLAVASESEIPFNKPLISAQPSSLIYSEKKDFLSISEIPEPIQVISNLSNKKNTSKDKDTWFVTSLPLPTRVILPQQRIADDFIKTPPAIQTKALSAQDLAAFKVTTFRPDPEPENNVNLDRMPDCITTVENKKQPVAKEKSNKKKKTKLFSKKKKPEKKKSEKKKIKLFSKKKKKNKKTASPDEANQVEESTENEE